MPACWADFDGDHRNELLVGQFSSGAIKIYRPGDSGLFEEGKFLEVNGAPAKIPGVW